MVEGIREGLWKINDANLINEMKTFVRNRSGKPQAMGKGTKGGCKDDRVFCIGIRHCSSNEITPPPEFETKYDANNRGD
jgi:hypothetical protein